MSSVCWRCTEVLPPRGGQLLRALDALPDAPTDLAREAVETLGAARPRRDRDPAA